MFCVSDVLSATSSEFYFLLFCLLFFFFFFFKQKTAYEMRISDWSSDVCSSDLHPTQGMSPPGQSGIRTRVLSSAELRTIWQAADKLGYPFGHMYQLLVCTGLRLTNVAHLVMDEYHDAHEALIVSPERMKRKPNDVRGSFLMPLNIPALVVMETVRELEIPYPKKMKVGDRPVFTTNGMQPIAGFSHAKNLIDAEIAEIDPEMAHWTKDRKST